MLITASGGARGKKQVLLKQIADKGVKLAAEGGFKVIPKPLHWLRLPQNPLSTLMDSELVSGPICWGAFPSHTCDQPHFAKTPIYSQA